MWFNGFTKDLATSVWVGYDDARPLLSIEEDEEITGASGAIPVWARFMKQATVLQDQREVRARLAAAEIFPAFPMPLGIEKIRVDIRTGRLSRDPEHSLTVTVRGTNPRERPDMIPPDGDEPEETSSTDPPAQAEPPGQAGQAAQER